MALFFFPGERDSSLLLLLAAILITYLLRRLSLRNHQKLHPGPPGLPLVGNVFQLGRFPWRQFTKWSQEYGPIYSLNLGGKHAVVVNTHKIASELLDKRSLIYSDRPRMIMPGEILCDNLFIPFNRYDDKLRKAAYEGLNKSASKAYYLVHIREATALALSLHEDSKRWVSHINRTTASTVLSVSYSGPPLTSSDDPAVTRIANFMHRLEHAAHPGEYLVEVFHWMVHIPSWLAKWKREGLEWHKKDSEMFYALYESAKERVIAGQAKQCLTSILIPKEELTEKETAWIAGTMFGAGSSTTDAVQQVFVLAMVSFPEAMKKAQAEIDRVVGRSRLPTPEDRSSLPYVRALIRETFRWRSIGPLGLPHTNTQDDVYGGYFIPKGTIVFYNGWAMNREPTVFPEPDVFRPERYLDETETKDYIPPYTHIEGHTTFGYGRRKCIGINVANNTLFMQIATMLWAFDIEKGRDEDGRIFTPDIDNFLDEGLNVVPAPFPCEFRIRGPEVIPILTQVHAEVEASLSG